MALILESFSSTPLSPSGKLGIRATRSIYLTHTNCMGVYDSIQGQILFVNTRITVGQARHKGN